MHHLFLLPASLLMAAASCTALAQTNDPASSVTVGSSTRNLLDLQRSGQQAGPELPMLGAASVLSYQRYLDSHKHPIPVALTSTVGSGNTASSK